MPNDQIYKTLIDYIQEDNRWKEKMNKTVSSIEAQTKLTNGRLNRLEPVVDNLEKASESSSNTTIINNTVRRTNWKWIAGVLTGIQFVLTTALYFFIDYLKHRYFH